MSENKSSKKVIYQILFIYLTTTGIFLAFFFTLWYQKLYEELIILQGNNLKEIHRNIVINIINSKFIPVEQSSKNIADSSKLKFAIFDKNQIFFDNLDFNLSKAKAKFKGRGIENGKVFFEAKMNSNNYYLINKNNEIDNEENALKIIIQGNDINQELLWIRIKVLICAIFAFLLLAIIAYFLVKIALKPLDEKIKFLNRFIKDSTHEINTPLSVILMSIEQLQKQNIENKKFERIKLAAKTLNQVYSDLVYYNFEHTLSKEKEELDLKKLICERLEYFKPFLEQKKITLISKLEKSFIFANKAQFVKLFDNLLSNAIKYNKKNGNINICLKENFLSINDSGIGIAKENLKNIFDRYARFNQDQGGFGIGLSLVKKICKENNISISCTSDENIGTTFTLKW
ncbi:HAMP domain-containing histidine kinase [Campylobacter sp. 2018MI35]|uniref:sensor histidine kinase n=1 Tax=unclassified Campylobacter TaxID=2593542 RepID=UPI001903D1F5|nr:MULTISPECIES: HAMP domain-containing sensor histidine kinase [unclassified Campylobacter]MBK1971009.1 HAMP domain-containing histidine kinase [Campylobacter sp. TTU_617]MBK1991372.1 HAMP domain-containing histidine kinase [Campylobacter sp. 2018MI34]